MSRLKDICIDCSDPWHLSHWWAEVLGYRVRPHSSEDLASLRDRGFDGPEFDPSIAVDSINESHPTIWFNRVPEIKLTKNRIHLDVFGDVNELVQHGATVISRLEHWAVMADPEGNEFCVFTKIRT